MVIGGEFAFFSRPCRGAGLSKPWNPVVSVASATFTTG